MKILFISTLSHNPGDEFIRLGQEHLLRQLFPKMRSVVAHKHDPRTLFAGFQRSSLPIHGRLMPFLYSIYARTYGRKRENRLETSDLVVFAGAPFIWYSDVWPFRSTCANAEWIGATWGRLFADLSGKPVLNLAAGSSFFDPSEAESLLRDAKAVEFLSRAVKRSSLTTVRDSIAQATLKKIGCDALLLPCTAMFAGRGASISPGEPRYVAINLMAAATHSWRRKRGDSGRWRVIISEVIPQIEKHHQVLFVCHSPDEERLAAEWFPGRRRVVSTDPSQLLRFYSKALFGLCNRVHAAAAIAAFGRPAIVVGGDSRIKLLEPFGLPTFDLRDIDAGTLLAAVREIECGYSSYVDLLVQKQQAAERDYLSAIHTALAIQLEPKPVDVRSATALSSNSA